MTESLRQKIKQTADTQLLTLSLLVTHHWATKSVHQKFAFDLIQLKQMITQS